jgi:hypothetical protein
VRSVISGTFGCHSSVEKPLAGGQPDAGPQVALEQYLPYAVGPALLLVEVVRPRLRALADGQHVRRVHAPPGVAGHGVDRSLDPHAGQVVLDDRVLVASDLPPGRRTVQVIGPDEERCIQPVAAALNDAAEQVLLDRGPVRDPALVHVAVDLGRYHEGHVPVAEVADRPLEEARPRNVVGVHLRHHVIDPPEGDPRVGREVQRSGDLGTAGVGALCREVALFPPGHTVARLWCGATPASAGTALGHSVAAPVTGRSADSRSEPPSVSGSG